MYKQYKDYNKQTVTNAIIRTEDGATVPFDPANTDFANFKKEILADEAQLQDADGNVMADAKEFVKGLP